MRRIAIACLIVLLLAFAQAPQGTEAATTVSVDGKANIFGAGRSAPPQPGGGGAGVLPTVIPLATGAGRIVTFADVTGTVSFSPGWNGGADGQDGCCSGTDISSFGGISGIQADVELFLTGVFLADGEPTDPSPSRLDFSGNRSFASLSPSLRQTFFIGDGMTGTGSGQTQQFHAPEGATRLYLGFADAGGFHNPPGFYDDNGGSLSVTVNVAGSATDSDRDGVPNDSDRCGSVAEDPDGFEDADGCPEQGNNRLICTSRRLIGCTIALNHERTQRLLAIVDGSGPLKVDGARRLCLGALIGSPLAAGACALLAAEVEVFSFLFSRELADQDRGNGVFITLGWPPGIVGQRDLR